MTISGAEGLARQPNVIFSQDLGTSLPIWVPPPQQINYCRGLCGGMSVAINNVSPMYLPPKTLARTLTFYTEFILGHRNYFEIFLYESRKNARDGRLGHRQNDVNHKTF